MNIWLINPFSDLPHEGASEGRFCCLARMLVEQGHDVVWWTVDFHHRTKRRRQAPSEGASEGQSGRGSGAGSLEIVLLPVSEYRKNVSFARLRSHRAYGREFQERVREHIQADANSLPDVVHLSSPPLDCIEPALQLKARYGCRVTVDLMDLWPQTFTRLLPNGPIGEAIGNVLFASFYRTAEHAFREADGISAVSAEYFEPVREANPGQDCHLCYVGGELSQEGLTQTEVSDSKTIRFIYVGAITPTYDLETVIVAASRVRNAGYAFELHFAGGGVSEDSLRQLVVKYELESHVTFLGFLDQSILQSALCDSHVGLNAIKSGTYITMPHKLSDYLCAGLAVINSIEGEADTLLSEWDAGTTYVVGDPDSLADSMLSYIRDNGLRRRHQANAQRLASEKFDRTKSYARMIEWIVPVD